MTTAGQTERQKLDANEIWEFLFNRTKDAVPEELTNEILADLAAHINKLWIDPLTELQHRRAEGAPSPVAFVTPETMKDILAQSLWTQGAVGEFRCDNREGFTVPLYADLPLASPSYGNTAQPDDGWVLVPRQRTEEMHRAAQSTTGAIITHRHSDEIWRAMLAASPSPPASEHVQFRLKWRAAARPPVHLEPMEGVQTFDTLAACVRFMSRQAADAEVISLTEIRSSSVDATASLLSALGEQL